MEHTFEELKKKRVVELREIASGMEHEAVQGYTQMNKDHLLAAVCTALGIDMHEHHIVKDTHKTDIKATIRELKAKREEAIAAHDHAEVKLIHRKIHKLKHKLRKMAV